MLPKRIILSRKGVDTSAGRFPSLILNDRLLSIPIPESEYDHSKRYRDVPLPAGPWQQYRNFEVLLKSLPRIAANQSSTKLVHLESGYTARVACGSRALAPRIRAMLRGRDRTDGCRVG